MSNVEKGQSTTLLYNGLASGLSDVVFNLYNPDRTQMLTNEAATGEIGTTKIYYYVFADTNTTGDWFGYGDSASRPKRNTISFRVERRYVSGGGGSASSCYWDKKLLEKLWKELKEIRKDSLKKDAITDEVVPLALRMNKINDQVSNMADSVEKLKHELVTELTPVKDERVDHLISVCDSFERNLKTLSETMIEALDAEALERITNNATETKKTNHGSKG